MRAMTPVRAGVMAVVAVVLSACEYNLPGPTITVTNTNTNTNTVDIHDVVNFVPVPNPSAPVPAPGGGSEVPLPLPTNAQAIAQGVATANPTLITNSCQATLGSAAWQFMDLVVKTLAVSDPRWGYLVKTNGQASQDVIAYRATSDTVGAWGVDVIIGHCGANPTFGWLVLGFDPNATWSASRNGT